MAQIIGTNAADRLSGVAGNDQIYGNKGNDTITGTTGGQELLVDGSFESAPVAEHSWSHFATVGGWQSDTGIEIWGKDFTEKASNGDKLMELDYDTRFSKVWQDVKTTAGEELTLNLDTAMRPNTAAASNGINIFWNGQQVAHIAPNSTAWKTSEFKVVGTGATDRLEFREDASGNDSLGGLIDNVSLKSPVHGNLLVGGSGNDKIVAGNNGDILVGGDANQNAPVDLTKMSIHQDVTAHVHFDGSGAGYHNTIGMYTYDDKGNVTSTKLLFADVSSQGVAGGPSAFDMALKAGQHIGFFVAPNAAGQTDIQSLLKDGGTFHLVNTSDGQPANVNSGEPMQIAYESTDHQWSNVHTQYWTDIFTTNTNDNRDGFQHAKVTTDPITGQLHVQFEDLMNGGDQNYHDANFTVDIGQTNAILMAHDHATGTHAPSNDDTLTGGTGDDTVLGMNGDDTLNGGLGNNYVNGGSGNDHIVAGGGNDVVVGGSGFDTLDFSAATAGVQVNLNKHVAAGFGNDKVYGVEGLVGSSHNDVLFGDKGANVIDGGAGNDVIRGGKGADVLTGGQGNDTFVWGAKDVGAGVDHVTDFGVGHDVLDLHALFKGSQAANAGNVQLVDDVTGSHLMAKVGGSFVEVAMLDNVHHTSAADLLKAGMLLV